MSKNAEYCGSQHLVEAKAHEGAEPSPKEKFQLVEYKEGDEDGAKQSDYSAGNCSIGDDGTHCGRKNRNQYLDNHVDNGVIGIHQRLRYARSARRLRLIQGVLNTCHARRS